MEGDHKVKLLKSNGVNYLLSFIIITSCFALWGFANDITNPMVKSFSKIFRMSVTDGALVQLAFYGGYFVMAFPTIYGISLKGLGDDAKFGAAGLIMTILGGSVLPPLQSSIIDLETIGNSFPAVNASFILPFISFAVIAWYGGRVARR